MALQVPEPRRGEKGFVYIQRLVRYLKAANIVSTRGAQLKNSAGGSTLSVTSSAALALELYSFGYAIGTAPNITVSEGLIYYGMSRASYAGGSVALADGTNYVYAALDLSTKVVSLAVNATLPESTAGEFRQLLYRLDYDADTEATTLEHIYSVGDITAPIWG